MILKTLHTSVILYTLNLQGCFLMNFFIFILFQEENMVFLNFLKREYFSRAISDPIKFSFFLFPSSFRPHQVFILFFPNPSSFHFSSFRPNQVFILFFPTPSSFHFSSYRLLSDPIKFSFFFFWGWFVIWKYKHMVACHFEICFFSFLMENSKVVEKPLDLTRQGINVNL